MKHNSSSIRLRLILKYLMVMAKMLNYLIINIEVHVMQI